MDAPRTTEPIIGRIVGGFRVERLIGSGGGSAAWTSGADRQMGWKPVAKGAAGVALALLGGFQPVEPAWDPVLMSDLPVGSAR